MSRNHVHVRRPCLSVFVYVPDPYYLDRLSVYKVRHGEKRGNSELLYWRLCCWRCGINSYVYFDDSIADASTCCTEPLTPLTRRQTATWLNQLDVMWCDSVSADNIRTTFVCLYCAAIKGTVCQILSKTLLCHYLVFKVTLWHYLYS